ncbi:acetate--CoA ligase family protein [Algihabitans albus]|uniref:acetate--CoA ligase family protein n=1 Tax=Algihabitans albus TaxID=2164067 RepID=UPI000E5CEC34|nr:acetate--CoA ligase [Algihabitans albus]
MTAALLAPLADCLLRPRSVAIVGASANLDKNNSRPQRYLAKHGYDGRVYPINPAYGTLFDEACYPSLTAVGAPIDHAYVMVPRQAVEGVVEDCIGAGVRCATIFTGGYAESGPAGIARQERLVSQARTGGLRLLGPNSLGVVNTRLPLTLSANAVLERDTLQAGRFGLVSQSGSLIGALVSRGQARGIRFSTLVSVGNESDLSVGEVAEMLLDDPDTDVVSLFLETLRDRAALEAMAAKAHAIGKPVMAYVLGRSELGRSLAQSHTGALAGQAAVMDTFLRELGVLRVDLFESLIETPPLLAGRQRPAGRRAAVVTTTGGGGAIVADHLGERGLTVVQPSTELRKALATHGLTIGETPVIDLTMAGTRQETVDACLGALIDDPGIDAVVMVVGSSSEFYPELAVTPLTKWAGAAKPIAAFLFPNAEESLALLAEAGIAAFRTPEACADALNAYLRWAPPRVRRTQPLPTAAVQIVEVHREAGDLNERDALALFSALGISVAECRVMPLGGPVPADLSYPVAAKILSSDIAHKSDLGGVALDLSDGTILLETARRLHRSVAAAQPDARLDGILIQPMVEGLAEVIVGFRIDPLAGPVVIVGVGGVLAEIYGDVSLRLAPVGRDEALAMLREVKGLAPLFGARGRPKGDVDALARTIEALSHLAADGGPAVQEAEINPLVVMNEGCGAVAVDGWVRLAKQGGIHD